jgi:hypothetical protein
MRGTILGIHAKSGNDVLAGETSDIACELAARGYKTECLNLLNPDARARFGDYMNSDEVLFAFGVQGVGSDLKTTADRTIWSVMRVPFIGLHHDHPCHNPLNHVNASAYVGNLYHFKSFYEVKERYLPSPQFSAYTPYGFFGPPLTPPINSFRERPIRLLYLKTGVAPEPLWNGLDQLPGFVRDALIDQIGRAEKDPNLELSDLVDEIFTATKIDKRSNRAQFWLLVRQMDTYLRAARAARFMEWLKKQEGAVIVGDGWDFVDKTGARAIFKPAVNIVEGNGLYREAQFICNTNPYARDLVHERTIIGLAMGCRVISDTNAWTDEHLADVAALTLFRWDRPLADQLDAAIAAPADLPEGERERVIERLTVPEIDTILSFAEQVRAFAAMKEA